jgi:hypothetical protein
MQSTLNSTNVISEKAATFLIHDKILKHILVHNTLSNKFPTHNNNCQILKVSFKVGDVYHPIQSPNLKTKSQLYLHHKDTMATRTIALVLSTG